jgi:anti-sigma regulatory factor (Ser/Thr protein kinase)
MKASLPYVMLAVRVAIAWWVLCIVITAIFSGGAAFVGGLILFPPLALAIGAVAAWLQHRALALLPTATSPLTLGQRQLINIALPLDQAMRVAESAVASSYGALEQRITENTITANVIERGVKATGLATLRGDELVIVAMQHDATKCTLQLSCEPRHVWFYALFWVDAGRCARQVETVRVAILSRVQQQSDNADAVLRQRSLKSRLAEVELLLLRAQIEPHFLFNTLAHIRASVGTTPEVAQAMLDALIVFMRANSQTSTEATITLASELKRTESYIEIMQLRLSGRLTSSIDCDDALRDVQVPNACVLILVENAVKHGIERIETPGLISVKCQRKDDNLVIEVSNDGPGLTSNAQSHDGGLSNLRERLHLSYGANARMNIEEREEGGVRATLRIPMQETPSP